MVKTGNRPRWIMAGIFALSLLGIVAGQEYGRARSPHAPWIHMWKSDQMMQASPIAELKAAPLRALLCGHIQPPGFDAVRALLVAFLEPENPADLLARADIYLSRAWALVYAGLNVLVFCWVFYATGSALFSLAAAFLWALHPAPITYSAFLEGTLLSTLLCTWLLYELLGRRHLRFLPLALAVTAAFYTRTVFQWYFYLPFFLAVRLRGWRGAQLAKLASVCLALALPLLARQILVAGTFSTTTFEGDHKLGILWHQVPVSELRVVAGEIPYPGWIESCGKQKAVHHNAARTKIFAERLSSHPAESAAGVARSIRLNFGALLEPSSVKDSTLHLLYPPAALYDFVLSGWRLALLVVASLVFWWKSRRQWAAKTQGRRAAAAVVLGYIFFILLLANRHEWTEVNRLKLLLEPAFHVFLFTGIFFAWRKRIS